MLLGYGRFCLHIATKASRNDLLTLPKDSKLKKIAFELAYIFRRLRLNFYLRPNKEVQDLFIDSQKHIKEDCIAAWSSTAAGRARLFFLLEKTFIKSFRGDGYKVNDPAFLKETFNNCKIEFVSEYHVESRNGLTFVYSQRMPLNAVPVKYAEQAQEVEHALLNVKCHKVKGDSLKSNPWYFDLDIQHDVSYLTVATHGDIGGSNVWVSSETLYLIDFEECNPDGLFGYDLVCWHLKFENYKSLGKLRQQFLADDLSHQWVLISEKLEKSNYFLFNRLNEKSLAYYPNSV